MIDVLSFYKIECQIPLLTTNNDFIFIFIIRLRTMIYKLQGL